MNPETERAKPTKNTEEEVDKSSPEKLSDEGFFESYSEHAKTLRTWLIAYGIGVPFLFATDQRFASILLQADVVVTPFVLFFSGIALQLMQVFGYKITMGYLYIYEKQPEITKDWWQVKCSIKWSDWTWPIVISDLGSMLLYGIATVQILNAFVRYTPL